jgi:hypothetical protein
VPRFYQVNRNALNAVANYVQVQSRVFRTVVDVAEDTDALAVYYHNNLNTYPVYTNIDY